MRLPTSVLLAVLAAAGLLALAPALVRRYDATERLEAERAQSTARVLSRNRRRRSMPGRRPVNPPRRLSVAPADARPADARPADAGPADAGSADHEPRYMTGPDSGAKSHDRQRVLSVAPRSAPPGRRQPRRPRHSAAIYRRRRVLAALILLNVVKLVGVAAVGPGFWIGFAVTGTLLLLFLGYLRYLAVTDRRRRRAEARRRAWLADQQAEVRREQERRTAERRAAARRMAQQRELLRRTTDGWSAPPMVSYRRASGGEEG